LFPHDPPNLSIELLALRSGEWINDRVTTGTEGGIPAYGGMADDREPVDPVGNEPSPLLFFTAGLIPLLLVGGWFLFR